MPSEFEDQRSEAQDQGRQADAHPQTHNAEQGSPEGFVFGVEEVAQDMPGALFASCAIWQQVRKGAMNRAVQRPLYAECGGMLVLGEQLTDLVGTTLRVAGRVAFPPRRGDLRGGTWRLRGGGGAHAGGGGRARGGQDLCRGSKAH